MNEHQRMREHQFVKHARERHSYIYATEESKEVEKGKKEEK